MPRSTCVYVWMKSKLKKALHECKLIGYTDVGDINNYLLAFERSILEDQSPQVAKHVVLMVRGIIVPVNRLYARDALRFT